jgi:hypothetical protein
MQSEDQCPGGSSRILLQDFFNQYIRRVKPIATAVNKTKLQLAFLRKTISKRFENLQKDIFWKNRRLTTGVKQVPFLEITIRIRN